MLPGARFGRAGEGVAQLPRRGGAVRALTSDRAGLHATLAIIPALTASAKDYWWIIGSAAVALHGADAGEVADIDLLTSARDATAMLASVGRDPDTAVDRTRFRSVYGRLPSPGLPIEVMGGLECRRDDMWVPIVPRTRLAVRVGDATLYIPDPAEMVAILTLFGRPKDLARAGRLRGAVRP